jgi:hypothetical protein
VATSLTKRKKERLDRPMLQDRAVTFPNHLRDADPVGSGVADHASGPFTELRNRRRSILYAQKKSN